MYHSFINYGNQTKLSERLSKEATE